VKLKSKGLGRKELVMDFREYTVTREGPEVLVTGTIKEPVTWDFSIRISQDDIPGMLKIGLNRHALRLALRWMLHLKPEQAVPSGSLSEVKTAKNARGAKGAKVASDTMDVKNEDDVDDVKEESA
jgi:hypothetical protein